MKKFLFLLFLFVALLSCETEFKKLEPEAKEVSLLFKYSGTANSYDDKEIFVKVLKDGFTHQEFKVIANTYRLNSGLSYTTKFTLEKGDYEFKGFMDWDYSTRQDSYEQTFSKHISITGGEVQTLEIDLQDNVSPNSLGWIKGSVRGDITNTAFPVYGEVFENINPTSFLVFKIGQNTDFNGCYSLYETVGLDPSIQYSIRIWHDINSNAEYDSGEPVGMQTHIQLSPGLPYARDFYLY